MHIVFTVSYLTNCSQYYYIITYKVYNNNMYKQAIFFYYIIKQIVSTIIQLCINILKFNLFSNIILFV